MRRINTLLAIIVGASAQAQEPCSIIPHVESDGSVSWIATVDAETVKSFDDAYNGGNDSYDRLESSPPAALNKLLDEKLSDVPWCSNGWYYRVDSPLYIEPLSDGGIRVKGGCRKFKKTSGSDQTKRGDAE